MLGRQEAQQLLDAVKETHPKVVEELIPNLLPLGGVVKVLQNLLKEQVPIRDLLAILETLADWSPITKDLDICIEGRHVLFVEDVIDTGLSIHYILRNLKTREPASLQVCTLFDKPRTRLFDPEVAYTGFMLPDKFVVGYGLDYDERYRNLPFVGVLKEEAITQRRLPVGAQT